MQSAEEFAVLNAISKQTRLIMAASFAIPFVVQFVLKGFMNKLWFWYDMMQIFTSFTFFSIDMP